MRMMMIAAAVALFVPAAAQAAPAPTVLSAGVRPGEHLICQLTYHEGTVIHRPVCMTERAWIRVRIRQEADVRQFQLKALSSMGR
jgi:hypothetical protein